MAYSALDVAKYVINYEHSQGREVSNLRLQKLLYFIQALVLVETDGPCFLDEMQAWEYGPVVPNVYHIFKIFGSLDIREKEEAPLIEEKIAGYIKEMIDFCKDFPTSQLVEITHKQDPWIQARKRGLKSVITTTSIRDYFKAQKK